MSSTLGKLGSRVTSIVPKPVFGLAMAAVFAAACAGGGTSSTPGTGGSSAGTAGNTGGGGNAAINRQILKSLRIMYPMVFTGNPNTEPPIRATRFTTHIPAWYNLKQGALAHSITNDSLFAWSLNPLPRERVYLVGDTWRTDVSGWSDAAYKGSIYVLNMHFGAAINPKEESTIKCINGDIVDPN